MSSRITRQIAHLKKIALGKAAVEVPKMTSLSLEFKIRNSHGHMGARKFWKEHLPSLQFHNPEVPMTVKLIPEPASEKEAMRAPSVLRAEFSNRAPVVIDMKNRQSEEILAEFIEASQSKPVKLQTFPVGEFAKIKLNKIR
ncbi:hypothetical protein BZA70DRAFT_271430 [Myxozyma melibiosi]|uniref:Ribosomal protein/NADH dehydrogenase domain-containing protein n=1 Tax=Myxozyma melibiosi TaxID=54550 RepID=A0ABR1FEM3_9ASCO